MKRPIDRRTVLALAPWGALAPFALGRAQAAGPGLSLADLRAAPGRAVAVDEKAAGALHLERHWEGSTLRARVINRALQGIDEADPNRPRIVGVASVSHLPPPPHGA